MKKLLTAIGLSLSLTLPTLAVTPGKDTQDLPDNSNAALGCMILLECMKGVEQIHADYKFDKFIPEMADEASKIIVALDKINVGVYIGDKKYFPRYLNGIYKPDYNRFFIRRDLLDDPRGFLSTLRHEGWHTVQDCMAGGISNPFIAQVYHDDQIPNWVKARAEELYGLAGQGAAIPWEADAIWAANQKGETAKGLEACANKTLYKEYPPTPKTKEWLIGCGFMKPEGKYYPYNENKKKQECIPKK